MAGKKFYTMDDFEFKGKTVLVRIDINSPIDLETKKITDTMRFKAHAKTLIELSNKGAKVVILAHQGRKGDDDFLPLEEHGRVLSEVLGRPVKYVDDVYGDKALKFISSLKDGELLLLENVRFCKEEDGTRTLEEQINSPMVRKLAGVADIYVNDAFSTAHRNHTSVVGFAYVLPSAAGRVMEQEVNSILNVTENPERPSVYVLGGMKAEDSYEIMKEALDNKIADFILPTGIISYLCLLGKGIDIGEVNKKMLSAKGLMDKIPEVKELLDKYGDVIKTIRDVAVDDGGRRLEILIEDLPTNKPIKDIGSKTIEEFSHILKEARTIVFNGPAGVYEDPKFAIGTRKLLEAVVESKAYSLVGGGHTIAAIEKYGYASKISYMSTAGKAFISFITDGCEALPAIRALEKAYKKHTSN
ncbi:MAG: phosphoglycerate kinase [Candidatus Jordarchaeaceae archaeon]